MGNWHRVIGIDLGTTFSAVTAYNFDKQEVRIIPNKQNEPTTPSVVYISQTGQVSVGKAAKEKLERDPSGVIIEVKRLMGDKKADGKKAMVELKNRSAYDPEMISAYILKELKINAERVIGEPVHDAVITVPAYFRESQKNATKEAARIAKLNPVLIINEPTAAAIAYGIESGEKQTFIVYDFGGGTFDVSIVRANSEKSFDVLGTGGDSNLGGGDIDARIVEWALGEMKRQYGRDLSGDAKLVGRLRVVAEKTKINLCNELAPQEFALANPFEGVDDFVTTLDVPTFDAMIQPLLDRTMQQVEVAMASARKQHDLTMDDVEAFILVGGSSKIPVVARALRERFRKPVKSDLNPDEVVALGAGHMAMGYTPSTGPEIREDVERRLDTTSAPASADHRDIKDVVSHTIGIGLRDDVYDRLILKDSVIPTRVQRDGYTTAADNQTSIFVPVYQGENPKASLNFELGRVVIDGLTPEPKGAHRFSVTFALDANGIFFGEVKHLQTGNVTPVKLDRGEGALTEKRLQSLADQVSSGTVPVSPSSVPGGMGGAPIPVSTPTGPKNPIDELLSQASEIMHTLQPAQQQELSILMQRLIQAQRSHDQVNQATVIAQMAMFMGRYRKAS